MNKFADYQAVNIPTLWASYQECLKNGVDKPYIEIGDYVEVYDIAYMDAEQFPLTTDGRKVASQTLPVVQVCKIAEDLWYTTVMGKDGKDYILYDSDIKLVYKLHKRCKRCMDCCYLVDKDGRYFCEDYNKKCIDINYCRSLRKQFYDELAEHLGIDEDTVTQVVIDNFGGKDLDELTDDEYYKLEELLENV